MAIGAFQHIAIALAHLQALGHRGNAAARIEMKLVRKFQSAVIHRSIIKRGPHQDRLVAWCGSDKWSKLRVLGAKITRIGQLGISQALVERGMAIRAKGLRSRGHWPCALMLGMAGYARSGPFLAKCIGDAGKEFATSTRHFARFVQSSRRGMIVHILVAGLAGFIAHRHKGLGMASLTIALKRMMRLAERSTRP